MSEFRIRSSRRADREVLTILEWLQSKSPVGAARWLDAFEAIQSRIVSDPHSFELADESDLFDEPVKQALFRTPRGNTYRALFVVRDTTVTVVSVRGPGQPPVRPEDLGSGMFAAH